MTHQISNASVIDRCEHRRRCDDVPPREDVFFHEPEYMIKAAQGLIRAAKCRANYTPDRARVADNLHDAFYDLENALKDFFGHFQADDERQI